MKHLIFVGACYIDTILSVPHYPDEDAKLRATRIQVRRGGNCGNTLEVLQQLLGTQSSLSPGSSASERQAGRDIKLHLVSTLPARDSRATETITSSFAGSPGDVPVRLAHCLYREEHTEAASSYIIRSETTGSRTIVNHNPLPEMTAPEFMSIVDEFQANKDVTETWWHFEGRIPETLLQCIEYLRLVLPSSRVSVEVEKPGRKGLREIAALADVVFYSKTWAESHGYHEAEACLIGEAPSRASLALCTWGAQGASALAWPPPVHPPVHIQAHIQAEGMQRRKHVIACPVEEPVAKVVDTVGAGDTFIAGVLFGAACRGNGAEGGDNWDAASTLSFAVKLATSKVQIEGFKGLASLVQGGGGKANVGQEVMSSETEG